MIVVAGKPHLNAAWARRGQHQQLASDTVPITTCCDAQCAQAHLKSCYAKHCSYQSGQVSCTKSQKDAALSCFKTSVLQTNSNCQSIGSYTPPVTPINRPFRLPGARVPQRGTTVAQPRPARVPMQAMFRQSYVNPYVSNGGWSQTRSGPVQRLVPPARGMTKKDLISKTLRPGHPSSRFGAMPSQMWARARNPGAPAYPQAQVVDPLALLPWVAALPQAPVAAQPQRDTRRRSRSTLVKAIQRGILR